MARHDETALTIFARKAGLSDADFHAAKALLLASPVAYTGEEALVQVEDLVLPVMATPSNTERTREYVQSLMGRLTTAITVRADRASLTSFPIVMNWQWADGSELVRFQLGSHFLRALQEIARAHSVPPY